MKVVLVAGAPGSGKSTLGLEISRELGLPLIDIDTITNPVLDALIDPVLGGDHWNSDLHRSVVRPARYAALNNAARDQVSAGVGAVLVAPFTLELAGGIEWQQLLDAVQPVQPDVFWLSTSAEVLAARRALRTERRDAHITEPPSDIAPTVPHRSLEASLSLEQLLSRVKQHLGIHRQVARDSPIFARTFDAFLFDLDGTLIDSTPAVIRSWIQLGEEFGLDPNSVGSGHGQPASQLIASIVPGPRVAEAVARIDAIEANDLDDITALDGAVDFIASLPQSAKAIVTSGTRNLAHARISAGGIPHPDIIVTFDDVTKGKPHPEPFLLAAERLGVDPARCLVFEDAPAGLLAARAAGCATVAIVGTHDAAGLDADLVVDGLHQLAVEPTDDGYRIIPR